jgi:hypothetical protein
MGVATAIFAAKSTGAFFQMAFHWQRSSFIARMNFACSANAAGPFRGAGLGICLRSFGSRSWCNASNCGAVSPTSFHGEVKPRERRH